MCLNGLVKHQEGNGQDTFDLNGDAEDAVDRFGDLVDIVDMWMDKVVRDWFSVLLCTLSCLLQIRVKAKTIG